LSNGISQPHLGISDTSSHKDDHALLSLCIANSG
jgi:hypothetical protein